MKMRYNRHTKVALHSRSTLPYLTLMISAGAAVLLSSGVALALGPAADSAVIDVSNPNITVDLSVLNDGGLAPHTPSPVGVRLPLNATTPVHKKASSGSKAPGAHIPVSTLYIQPAKKFRLPAQTKPLIVQAAPASRVATNAPVQAPDIEARPMASAPPPMERVPKAVVVAPPPVLTPVVSTKPTLPIIPPVTAAPVPPQAPVQTPTIEAKADVPAPAPIVPPEPAPVAQIATPPAKPKIKSVPAAMTPPPPPLALPQAPVHDLKTAQDIPPAPAPAPVSKAHTGAALVVDLPPHDGAQQPGVASLPPTNGPLGDGDNMRIVFEQDSSKLPQEARDALKTMSEKMRTQDNLRLQLLAYAGDTNTSASAARRLSLSRALAVRSFLIETGVRSTRIDVRALGNKSTDAVTERVDITVVER